METLLSLGRIEGHGLKDIRTRKVMTMQPGTQIGHYQIRSHIGSGGMGDVYRAFDLSLCRPVAIKVLQTKLIENKEHWHRFQREARTVSGLNHPNILTIYEIGDAEIPYLVTELIEGKTLRQKLRHLKDVLEVIDIAVQIAGALVSANEAGIIHRDIKPENIMIRRDGYVKVLDFGLAKLIDDFPDSTGKERTSDQSTITLHTDPRSIVGTVSYMSPEQLRGLKLDPRTDIWSLGVVMFEMIAGLSPFERPSNSDRIAAILEYEPPPLSASVANIPQELQRIVAKALCKQRDERYQTTKDLLVDLKNLKRDLEFEAKFRPLDHSNQQTSPSLDQPHRVRRGNTIDPESARQTSRYSTSWIANSQRMTPLVVVYLALLSLTLLGAYYFSRVQNPSGKAVPTATQIVNLTNTGKSILAAISPDGKYLIHVLEDGEEQVLSVKSLGTGTSATIIPAEKANYLGLTFSNDGEYIYYVRYEETDLGKLYQTTLLGGTPKKLLDNVDSPIAFSPDGTMMAFVQVNKTQGEYYLMVAAADGSGARRLTSRRDRENLSVNGPDWSPDSKHIVCGAGDWKGGYHMNIIEVDLNGGERTLAGNPWFSVLQLVFLNDNTIVASASIKAAGPHQLWKISYPGGTVARLTTDLNDYVSVSKSRETNALYSVQNNRSKTIWISSVDESGRDQKIGTAVGPSYGLAWSPDSRILLSSMTGSDLNISALSPEGTGTSLLTVNSGDNYHPHPSADGRYIVFASNRTGSFNIWRMNAADGSNPVQLTTGGGDFYPYCTPDSKWVIYEHQSNGVPSLWKVSIDGASAVQLTNTYSSVPVVSPDGKYIACRSYVGNDVKGIAILSIDGGPPLKLLRIPIINWQRVRWTGDGKSLSYVDTRDQVYNIWLQPLEGGPAKQVTKFRGDEIFSYDWSPDHLRLVCERGAEVSDVVVLKGLN